MHDSSTPPHGAKPPSATDHPADAHPSLEPASPLAQGALASRLERLRRAQQAWARQPWPHRLRCIGQVAGGLARQAESLASSVYRPASTWSEVLASEVLPVAEACRYVARRGGQILRPQRLAARDNPWWMGRIVVRQSAQPLGVILIIGPSNYPFFLNAVPMVQALAAGNAVLVKPAPGCETVIHRFKEILAAVGIPSDLIEVLDTTPETAMQVVELGVDKVIFTGSHQNGQLVAQRLAQRLIPGTFELSGNDAVIVLPDANLPLVCKSIAYALTLNGGQTCIAPRRVIASGPTLERLLPLLREQLQSAPARSIAAPGLQAATHAVLNSLHQGAQVAIGSLEQFGQADRVRPLVLDRVTPEMPVANSDLFAPLLSLLTVEDTQQAILVANACPYALGAAVFGEMHAASLVASQLSAPCVAINDVLAPTADPRVSFGGRGASGYGVTRGLEGLRQLTQLKVVCERRGRWLPHLTTSPAQLGGILGAIMLLRHGPTWSDKWRGVKNLVISGRTRAAGRKSKDSNQDD